jgi:hypothetical protein
MKKEFFLKVGINAFDRMKVKAIAILFCCTTLVSCVSFPQSPLGLLSSNNQSQEYCYTESSSVVVQRIKSYLNSCYRPWTIRSSVFAGGFSNPVSVTINWRVTEEPIGESIQLSVATQHGFALTSVVKPANGSCVSTMRAYGATSLWMNRFEQLNIAAKGGVPKCLQDGTPAT